ncbi:MAG: TMEM175 family protein [Bacteroidia bacterium]
MSTPFHEEFQKNERIIMFSDGVFAIVVTLLVLELKAPALTNHTSSAELLTALIAMKQKFVSFVLSFLFVVMLWVAHNIWFRTLIKTDTTVMWINNLFLLLVCFIPFPTALIGEYPGNSTAMVIFGINWMLIGIVMWYVGHYCFKSGFVSEHVDHKRYGEAIRIMGLLLPLSVVPIAIAWYHPLTSLAIYLSMIVVGIVISFRIRLRV